MSKSSTTKTKPADTKSKTSKKTATKQDLLYIMSNSCGWCKKAQPIVDELVSEGAKITTLDVQNPDESKRANEIKQKYNVQCGTPLFIDAESGNMKCGFAEKDVIQKWANGEEIPKPPQPKSPPPPPPKDLENSSEVKEFTTKYEKWAKDNKHLPNLLTIDQVIDRLKQSRDRQAQMGNNPQGAPQGAPMGAPAGAAAGGQPQNAPLGGASNYQPQFNQQFYYLVQNGKREVVMSNPQSLNGLQQQYFFQETNGQLTKVVGDTNWNPNAQFGVGRSAIDPNQHPAAAQAAQKRDVDPKVKAKIEETKKAAELKKKTTASKSKTNTKTIKGL